MIGYWLVQALQNALPGRQVVCLVSQAPGQSPDDPTCRCAAPISSRTTTTGQAAWVAT